MPINQTEQSEDAGAITLRQSLPQGENDRLKEFLI